MNYSENIAEIECILARFRNEQMSVDELTEQVARATKLIAACRAQLLKTEQELGSSQTPVAP